MFFAKAASADHHTGHVVTGFFISAIPAVVHVDLGDVWQRLLLAGCGGLGAFLAIIGDRPKSFQDAIARIVCGVISCFLFGPFLARRFGYEADVDGVVLVFGVTGVASWYIVGSITDGLVKLRANGGLWRLVRRAAGVTLADPKPPTAEKP